MQRNYSFIDQVLINIDQGIRSVFAPAPTAQRANPGDNYSEANLTDEDRKHCAGLMRINHTGEICAQGLYQGQALTARLDDVREQMEQAALEENEHLAWCEQRLEELDSHTSYLNPLWYCGSFFIGAMAGLAGDKWSLGFVAETENQVQKHLENHMEKIPSTDKKSQAILQQMHEDEAHHAQTAINAGAAILPSTIKSTMRYSSKIMTSTVYWI